MKNPFKVINAGDQYIIIYKSGDVWRSYKSEVNADDICELLNIAHEQGYESRKAEEEKLKSEFDVIEKIVSIEESLHGIYGSLGKLENEINDLKKG